MPPKRVVKKKVIAKNIPTTRTPGSGPPRSAGRSKEAKPAEPVFFGAKPVRRRGTSSGYQAPSSNSGGSWISTIMLWLVAIALLGGVAVCFVQPDLSAIAGYPAAGSAKGSPNLLRELDDAISYAYTEKKESTLTFTEEQINAYINERLQKSQQGPFASSVKIEGIFCDLQPDTATLYLVRNVFGHPLVSFATWAFDGDPDDQHFRAQTSGIGLIKIAGPGISSIMAPFANLKDACAREAGGLRDPTVDTVRIEDGRLIVHVQ